MARHDQPGCLSGCSGCGFLILAGGLILIAVGIVLGCGAGGLLMLGGH
jgi:hypothetical protein